MKFKIYYLSVVSWFSSAKEKLKNHSRQKKDLHDFNLKGRIKELESSTNAVLKDLSEVRLRLSQKVDAHIFKHVAQIIDPMANDVRKYHGQIKEEKDKESSEIETQKFEKVRILNEKAKQWVKMSKSVEYSDEVVKAIVQHTHAEIQRQIDQDLQILNNYHEHYFEADEHLIEDKQSITKEVVDELTPFIVALEALKECSIEGDLQSLRQWREKINSRRSYLFESALHLIENFKGERAGRVFGEAPTKESQVLSKRIDQLVDGLSEMEETIQELRDTRYDEALQRLDGFAEEAHLLNEDLRLTSDQFEKLQEVFSVLEKVQKDFQS